MPTVSEASSLSTRTLTLTGLLAAVALALQASGLGFVPVPTPAGAITILHVPAIVAGILAGPWSGCAVGGVFGAYTLMNFAPPDPRVHLLPRLLVGPLAWLVFRAALPLAPALRSALAAASATLFHTAGVTGLAVGLGWFPAAAMLPVAALHGPLEAGAAVLLTVPIVRALSGRNSAPIGGRRP